MPLTVDWKGVENFDELKAEEGGLIPLVHTIVMLLPVIGISEITEANEAEFFARFRLAEQLDGPFFRQGDGEPYYITPQDIRRLRGLKSNAYTGESRLQYLKRLGMSFLREQERTFKEANV